MVIEAKKKKDASLRRFTEKKNVERVVHTLDYKGRINENIYDLYPGLYNAVNAPKTGTSAAQYEHKQLIDESVVNNFRAFENRRAPQSMSRSLSPYLLANSFNIDVTEILIEVKEAREK